MKKTICVLLNVLISLTPNLLQAQTENLIFQNFTTKDGLSNNNVFTICQDNEGFLWFGTRNGLNRYDGYIFNHYYHDNKDSTSIASNNFGKIFRDRYGIMWFGTYNSGINRYDPLNQTYQHFVFDPDDSTSLIGNFNSCFFQDSYGIIWVGTNSGFCYYDSVKNNFTRSENILFDQPNFSFNYARSIVEDKSKNLWIGTGNAGLYKLDRKTNKFTNFSNISKNKSSIISSKIYSLCVDSYGIIWIGTRNKGLDTYDTKTAKFHSIETPTYLDNVRINCIFQDSYNNIWIGTYNKGIVKYDYLTQTFSIHNYESRSNISTNPIEAIYEDNSNNLWIASRGDGLYKVDLKPRKFTNYLYEPNNFNSIPGSKITTVCSENNNLLWIGTEQNGISLFDRKKNKFLNFQHDPDNSNSLSKNRVRYIMIDHNNTIWIGTYNGGLNKLIRIDEKYYFTHFYNIPDDPESLLSDKINFIYEDDDYTIWVGTIQGLCCFNNDDNEKLSFKRYYNAPEDSTSLSDNYITSIFQDGLGKIWITTGNGLNQFNKKTQNFKQFLYIKDDSTSLNSNRTLSIIYEDKSGTLWVGTADEGINMFNRETQQFIAFKDGNKVAHNIIMGILEDNQNNLWLSKTNGLTKFNLKDHTFRNYTFLDGLPCNEFFRNAHCITSEGEMIFGSYSGLTIFNPSQIADNTKIPKIVITDFKKFNQSIFRNKNSFSEQNPNNLKTIELSHKDYLFSIEFAAIDFTRPEKNQYSYKMIGLTDEWTDLGDRKFVPFTNIPAGKYTFQVIGSNNDGYWNYEGASLNINILPPWWKTLTAYLIYIAILISIIISLIKYREKKLKTEKERLEKIVKERTSEIITQKAELETTLENLTRTQTQLIQSEKMASVGQLTAGVAHELNNPINYITGGIASISMMLEDFKTIQDKYLEINQDNIHKKLDEIKALQDKLEYPELVTEYENLIKSIKNGADKAIEIVQSLRTFSRLDEIESKLVNIHKNLDATLVMLRNRIENRIEILKQYGKIPEIECSPGSLNQVFMNIILNAIDAIRGKGTIYIKTHTIENGSKVCIAIKDTGKGMTEETRSQIFEPFFTTKETGKGKGLGLSIAHGIMEEHHGTIEVESKPGSGSEFIIQIPINSRNK